MQALYECLERGGVGLMESPTGTGKTISLICGSLQWLLDHRQREQAAKQKKQAVLGSGGAGDDDDLPDWLMEGAGGAAGGSGGGEGAKCRGEMARERHAAGRATGVVAGSSGRGGGVSTLGSGAASGKAAQQRAAAAAAAGGGLDPELEQFCLEDVQEAGTSGGAAAAGRRRRAAGPPGGDSSGEDEPVSSSAAVASGQADWEREPADAAPCRTQVLFCSRTHSQLSQVVGELRRTRLPASVSALALAGRRVLCVHEPVRAGGPPGLINERCLDLQQKKPPSSQQQRGGKPHEAAPGQGQKKARQQEGGARRTGSSACGGGCPHLAALRPGADDEAWEAFVDDALGAPLDVEDLARAGAARGVCPYYGARRLASHADLLLLPYSALLSADAREALGIRLEGAVVIFDEAHNLVDAVNSAHGAGVSLTQLRAAQRQLRAYLERFSTRLSPRNAQQVQLLIRIVSALASALSPKPAPAAAAAGAPARPAGTAPVPMEPGRQPSTAAGQGACGGGQDAPVGAAAAAAAVAGPKGRVVTANDFLFECRLESVNMLALLAWAKEVKLLNKVAGYAVTQEVSATVDDSAAAAAAGGGGGAAAACEPSTRSERMSCMHACTGFLAALTNPDADGRVVVSAPAAPSTAASGAAAAAAQATGLPGQGRRAVQQGRGEAGAEEAGPSLKYVLLNAASHFAKVLSSARAVVLASGTLSPIQGLVQQLFPAVPQEAVRHYECGHIVPAENLVALVAGRGPSGLQLSLRHQERGKPEVMDEVGRVLLNVCSAAPDGVVVFVPSFVQLDLLVARWSASGLMAKLEAKKQVFKEPRGAAQVEAVLQQYARCIAEAKARRQRQQQLQQQGPQSQSLQAPALVSGQTGGLLLSVVGAKLSEGINFGDELGRCVVVVGMPYPNPQDPELKERMDFLDKQGTAFTGQQYYEDLCMKAVNQCIGRVIRHRGDYAAIVLADCRYLGQQQGQGQGQQQGLGTMQQQQGRQHGARARPLDKLPGWMRPSLVDQELAFGQVMGRLHGFFRAKREQQQQPPEVGG